MWFSTSRLKGPTRLQPLLLSLLVPLLLQPTRGSLEVEDMASPRFGVVIDAGSSGTRVTVFQWDDAKPMGESLVQLANQKTKPGISMLAATPEEQLSTAGLAAATRRVHEHLAPLIQFATQAVPAKHHTSTGLLCYATAGVRLLPQISKELLMGHVLDTLVRTPFQVDGQFVAAISGEREAFYSYLAINSALGLPLLPASRAEAAVTVGALDMGGASTQISYLKIDEFEQGPARHHRRRQQQQQQQQLFQLLPADNWINANSTTTPSHSHDASSAPTQPDHLLTTSHLGFGVKEAFKTLIKHQRAAWAEAEEQRREEQNWFQRLPFVHKSDGSVDDASPTSPCMHPGQEFTLQGDNRTFRGTGDFHACRQLARELVQGAVGSDEARSSWRASPPPATTTFFAIDFFATVVDMMAQPAPAAPAPHQRAGEPLIASADFQGHTLHAPTGPQLVAGGQAMCATPWADFTHWQIEAKGQSMKKVEAACFGAAYLVELFKAYRVFDVDQRRRNQAHKLAGQPTAWPRLLFTEELSGFEASWAVGALVEWGLHQLPPETTAPSAGAVAATAASNLGWPEPFAWRWDPKWETTWLYIVCKWILSAIGGWVAYLHLLADQPQLVKQALSSPKSPSTGTSSPPPTTSSSTTSTTDPPSASRSVPVSQSTSAGKVTSPQANDGHKRQLRFLPSLGDLHF